MELKAAVRSGLPQGQTLFKGKGSFRFRIGRHIGRPCRAQAHRGRLQHRRRGGQQMDASLGARHMVPSDGPQPFRQPAMGGTPVISPLVQQDRQIKGVTAAGEELVHPQPGQGRLRLLRAGQSQGRDGKIARNAVGPQKALFCRAPGPRIDQGGQQLKRL